MGERLRPEIQIRVRANGKSAGDNTVPLRLGLCCIVLDAPIRFRAATHAYVWKLDPDARRRYLSEIALHNARMLTEALRYCDRLDIRAFRIVSQLFPLATHPLSGYRLEDLDGPEDIRGALLEARDAATGFGIRLSFHPDQFIVLNSLRPEVVESAITELEWQGELAAILGADVICLHGGSTTGGFEAATARLELGISRLSARVRSRLALENDDRCFPLIELLPVSLSCGVPLVLDAHHHRIMDGGLTIEEATEWALASWGDREPYFHVSSPRNGWKKGDPRLHADYIDVNDVPDAWRVLDRRISVDVEAKEKERAVVALSVSLAADAGVRSNTGR